MVRNQLFLLILVLGGACGGSEITGTTDPANARIITTDITNFWRAYDAGGKDGDATAFQREYLDRASAGLRDFASKRTVSAQSLRDMVRVYPRYFAAVRTPMLSLGTNAAVTSAIRTAFTRLEELYPDAIFPPVTLLVGRFSTGGTTSSSGLLIGAEFYADATVPRDELGAFQRANVQGAEALPFIVAHESIHVQQATAGTIRGSSGTLLEQSLSEGSADFLGELISGGHINSALRVWALSREAEVWADFKSAMNNTDISRWLYNQGSATAKRPGDLGYFVGYQIAKAYYDKQADKRAAVRAIIHVANANAFLTASGYDPK